MRKSCDGCRVLRKGCSESCSIRPCLQWIHSSDSQANATLFLAKFYGRAGLLNLIEAGPQELQLLSSIVNPVYGSIGMLCSGSWVECQAAVEAVLRPDDNPNFGGSKEDHDSILSKKSLSSSNVGLQPTLALVPEALQE
ncbi:LOB domain-containing protein 42 [Hibiscus syriacus]|uniref:LOB domain-containing protein 42 n=1 Tax=Hibiscus syriacus TaxID=106335 RepID=A0A6A2X1D1_HIBSY|nr:LOB domain-containing protein 42 [Hibiscus syriacus]